MTTKVKAQAIAALLVVVSVCIWTLTAMPKTAFAAGSDDSDIYTGIVAPSYIDLHSQTKRTTPLNEAPSITVFTHGMNGNFQHWGSIYNGNNYSGFDLESLPMQLKAKLNGEATVYVAHKVNTYQQNGTVYCTIDGENFYAHNETYSEFSIQKVNDDGTLGDSIRGDDRIDFANHTIVIFNEQHYSNLEIALRYKQLHDIIDKLLYEYNEKYGIVPRINLIGHSRGGLLNMMYANEHPYNVDTMYSFGSPYNGSLPSQILKELIELLGEDGQFLRDKLLRSTVDIYDINNTTNDIKIDWNNKGTAANVNFKTLTSTFDFNFLIALLLTDEMFGYIEDVEFEIFVNVLDQIIDALQKVEYTEIALSAYNLVKAMTPIFGLLATLIFGATSIAQLVSATATARLLNSLRNIRTSTTSTKECYDGLVRALYDVRDDGATLLNTLCQMLLDDNIVSNEVLGDVMVQLNSQRADGYNGASNLYHESFTVSLYEDGNAITYVGKDSANDSLILTSAHGEPAIPHNLECRNSHLVNAVLEDIRVGQPICHHKLSYKSNGATTHSSVCVNCGLATGSQQHTIKYVSSNAFRHYEACYYCDFVGSFGYHADFLDIKKQKCLRCGYSGMIGFPPSLSINKLIGCDNEFNCSSR